MEYDSKLKEFSNIVLREASEEKQKVLSDVKEKINEANKKIKEDIIEKAEQNLNLEAEKIVRKKNETLSKFAMEARKSIIEKREELLEQIYDTLVKKITEFINSSDYTDWLIKQIKDAQNQLNDKMLVVYIDEKDEKLNLAEKLNLKVVIDKEIKLGGCRIISETKRMMVDSTLQKRLDENFMGFDKLTIKC